MNVTRRPLPRAVSVSPLARRSGVAALPSLPPSPPTSGSTKCAIGYEDYVYRAPYKFGGRVVDRVTLLNVRCRVTTRNGKSAWGFGSMTMGNMWAFPSATLSYDTTLEAMKALAERVARITDDCKDAGHPLDLAHVLEPEYPEGGRARCPSTRKLDRADSQAVHARGRQPVRRRASTTRSGRSTAGTSTRPTAPT